VSNDERRNPAGGPPGVPGVMTFGTAAAGEVLVNRYRLEDHIDTDTAGRQIWRGIDTVLRRPVALVIREPGGDAAAGMLTMAVAASRLVHPHIVSVYDAIDEGDRAYLVREWVPGVALRDVLAQAPLDPERATLVTHAIAEAVAALHTAGIVHGNIHPGTVLIADDGRVVLMDAHADAPTDPEYDVRAVGAVLYACLTGHWPYAEAGRSALPDALRDGHGRITRPRQVRAGIPRHLDEIAAELLDPSVEPPPATVLAGEFARLATTGEFDSGYENGGYDGSTYDASAYDEHHYDDDRSSGPMGFADHGGGRPRRGRLFLGIAVLTVIAVVGALVGAKLLSSPPAPGPTQAGGPTAPSASAASTPGKAIALTSAQIRIVDPPNGDRTEFEGYEQMVDGNEQTGWTTDEYNQANFGSIKPGMGVLINLGAPTKVSAVKISMSQKGSSITLRTGTSDPGNTTAGDDSIAKNFTTIGSPQDQAATNLVLNVDKDGVQYLLIWITKLPANAEGKFVLTINEISVLGA
jgi:eukaryotic-like serine/threonine-protein kinase